MPGIVGLLTKKPREWAEPQLARMIESMRHESFYVTGTWIDESSGVYVGWVTRENSFSDGMPVRNERGDVVLVFSGEDYPEPETALRLKERGHEFEEGDASYLVHVYEDDVDFFKNLNGRFQGVIADRTRGIVTLFNDRFGLQRIYYSRGAQRVLLLRGSQGNPGGSPGTAQHGPAKSGRVHRLRMRPRESHSVSRHTRTATRLGLDFSRRRPRKQKRLL